MWSASLEILVVRTLKAQDRRVTSHNRQADKHMTLNPSMPGQDEPTAVFRDTMKRGTVHPHPDGIAQVQCGDPGADLRVDSRERIRSSSWPPS